MVALGACSNEELMTDANPDAKPHTGRTLSYTAAMPGEGVTTRVGLTQEDDKTITLTWQADDELQLAFVQGDIKAKNIAKIASMSADKKKATFEIELPEEIDLEAVFNLYGVYGAGTIDITGTNPIVTLPTDPGSAESLTDVQNRKDVMLSFQSLSVDINGEPISVLFTHLGSLFSITVKNSSTESLEGLYTASLKGINNSDNQNWAYNAGIGNQTYDLVNKTFQNATSAGNIISFSKIKNTVPSDGTFTSWGWYPPLPSVHWPQLQLGLVIYNTGNPLRLQTLSH